MWLKTVSSKLKEGALITIDYGKRFAGAPNPPRTYFRHSTDTLLTDRRGLKDITASVDFESLIAAGQNLKLSLESYSTMTRFLIDRGIADWLPLETDIESLKSRTKIKTLLHPEGMGETYKVLIQTKSETAA
jgi:SAM-dependent MidA family methyltransferase